MIGQQCCLFPGRPIFNRCMEGVIIGVIETHPYDPHFQEDNVYTPPELHKLS